MAVWFESHFEDNDFSEWTDTQTNGASNTITTHQPLAKAGTYSALVHLEGAVSGDYAYARHTNFASLGDGTTIFASAWYYFPADFEADTILRLFRVQEQGAPWSGVYVELDADNQLQLLDGNGTHTQTSPISVSTGDWTGIEVEIYVHATEGYLKLRQDGVVIVEATGLNTVCDNNYGRLGYGCVYVTGNQTEEDFYFDEVYVQDSQKIGAPAVDETPARVKGVIRQSSDATAARVKGSIARTIVRDCEERGK